jgi:D-alanyl-D-alanine carboxypeptidase (penicillin-binding protein 5/6)
VDGLKTGYTEDAGYHLLATAKRGDQRFIAVVMGAKSPAIREREVLRLLNYGFRNFVSVQLFEKEEELLQLPVWKGNEGQVELLAGEDGVVTVPIPEQSDVSWQPKTPERLFAPIDGGQTIGEARITIQDKVVKSVPLLAGRDIPLAGFLKRAVHSATLVTIDHRRGLLLAALVLCATVVLIWFLKQRRPRRRRG